MHKASRLAILAVFLPAFAGCATSPRSSDRQAQLVHNPQLDEISMEMRGRNATAAILGAIGEKVHQEKGDQGYFQRYHLPTYRNLKVTQLGQFKVTDSVKANLSKVGVNVAGLLEAGGSAERGASQDYQVNLVDVESTLEMQRELSAIAGADPDIKAYLMRPEARVITMVGTVTAYKSTDKASMAIDLTGGKSIGKYTVKASLGGGFDSVKEFIISSQATVLYRMSKLCWTDNEKLFLKVDYLGGDPCSSVAQR